MHKTFTRVDIFQKAGENPSVADCWTLRKIEGILWWNAGGPFNSEQPVSLYSSSILRGLQGGFPEAMQKPRTPEAPQTESSSRTSGNLFKKL